MNNSRKSIREGDPFLANGPLNPFDPFPREKQFCEWIADRISNGEGDPYHANNGRTYRIGIFLRIYSRESIRANQKKRHSRIAAN